MIDLKELQRLIAEKIDDYSPRLDTEKVRLSDAFGRILAEDVFSTTDFPRKNISAMDGYAFHVSEKLKAGEELAVVGESVAGRPFSGKLENGTCVRIMTGAILPDEANCVQMQEHVHQKDDQHIALTEDASEGGNIRYAAEEFASDEKILSKGSRVTSAEIMVLAAVGLAEVKVFRKLRVAVLSSGDELVEPGNALIEDAHIYDCNRAMIKAKLMDFPVEMIDLGIVADKPQMIREKLIYSATEADVIITSGSVSVGNYDFLKEVVTQIGTIHQYKVAMKPGKPFVFGQIENTWFFGLPGNPVSGFVCFDMIIRAALWQLAGARIPDFLRTEGVLAEKTRKKPGRLDVQRVRMTQDVSGCLKAIPSGAQDSHRILGLCRANAYMLLPRDAADMNEGETVELQPWKDRFL